MRNLIDTLLRWHLEWKRYRQGGELTISDWKSLYRLRGESTWLFTKPFPNKEQL